MSVAEGLSRLQASADDGRLDMLCEEHGVRVLTVFGSAVSSASSARDLDVAVAYRTGESRDDVKLIDALLALSGIDEVDLLVLDGASPTARRNALVGVIPLYEASPGDYARLQVSAMLEFMDTAWLRRLDLELLAR